ncbi:hypothetical protein AZE42_03542 [Rhizopogon vesiculosus]|uniref:F-box domain-containing protein n=1 Tax=Rhizopogon vesiculosus TaxID=180088 RepID=A0A1J8PNC7_9AGAM|nr:hypothetical protein AZE42_03542 [Rhizopogon vesiculosus]
MAQSGLGCSTEHHSWALPPSPTSTVSPSITLRQNEPIIVGLSPIKQPPPEILLEIFKFALPPAVFLDASLAGGPFSPWCLAQRTKKSIVLVCKLWCMTGTVLLYKDIHIRHIGQIAALFNTLQENPRLGMMIEAINVFCHVAHQYSVMFDEALQRILEMSPNATRISLNMDVCEALTKTIHKYDLSGVVHLEVGEIFFPEVLPCLAQCKNLAILSIETIRGIICTDLLTLEHLQELQISWSSEPTNLNILDIIARNWTMPCLRRFMLHQVQFALGHAFPEYTHFLDVHGKYLTTLSITAPMTYKYWGYDIEDVQTFLDRCPALKHLALVSPTFDSWAGVLPHKCLRWIDIWSAPDPGPSHHAVEWPLKVQDFPQLQVIRRFDWPLLDTVGPRLPLIIPPDSGQHPKTFKWRFPGIDVQDYGGYIYRQDMIYVPLSIAVCDGHGPDSMLVDSDDRSFGSVSSTSYSAYDSEGDLEMLEVFDLSDGDSEDETAIDLETTLQIYRDILNADCDL